MASPVLPLCSCTPCQRAHLRGLTRMSAQTFPCKHSKHVRHSPRETTHALCVRTVIFSWPTKTLKCLCSAILTGCRQTNHGILLIPASTGCRISTNLMTIGELELNVMSFYHYLILLDCVLWEDDFSWSCTRKAEDEEFCL